MPDADAPSFKLKVEITDAAIEVAKNQEITISGKDPAAAMLVRLEARLQGKGSEGQRMTGELSDQEVFDHG